jgi:hypothetical protein
MGLFRPVAGQLTVDRPTLGQDANTATWLVVREVSDLRAAVVAQRSALALSPKQRDSEELCVSRTATCFASTQFWLQKIRGFPTVTLTLHVKAKQFAPVQRLRSGAQSHLVKSLY